jgi:hypothetical protein
MMIRAMPITVSMERSSSIPQRRPNGTLAPR